MNDPRQTMSDEARVNPRQTTFALGRAEANANRTEAAIEAALDELGVPSAAYPANVANAYDLLVPFSLRHLAATTEAHDDE